MALLANLKSILTGGVQKLSGRKDALEAVCAAAALIAAADGDISDAEVAATSKAVKANPSLTAAFAQRDIEIAIDAMMSRAEGGRSGRQGLLREIEQIAADRDIAEIVYLAALDVAESDGSIGEKEKAVLTRICTTLGLNPANYDI